MMDVTVIQTFLGGTVHLAGAFDAFSRVPIALQVLECQPGTAGMARLLKAAVRAFGPPRYLITDLGSEFDGKVFRKAAARLGIVSASLPAITTTPPPAWNDSGEPSKTPRAFVSRPHSPSRTWSEGSNPPSLTTSPIDRIRDSRAPPPPKPSSARNPPTAVRHHRRGAGRVKDPSDRPSPSISSTESAEPFRS
jgi:hypothetical protein